MDSKSWTEKYRPRKLEDLVLEKSTFNKIQKIFEDKEMPNIIITGLPGIGKTTTILCIARALLGRYYKSGVLELNASDDRGIKAVQEPIIYFCKKKLYIEPENGRKYASHKIILLDEADNMTKKAQQQINNLMEQYNETTRFAFTCNNSSDIIEAIQSRCIIFRYKRLSQTRIKERLKYICEKEEVEYDDEGMDAIVCTAQGDLRSAINNLHITHIGYEKITKDNVYKLCNKPQPEVINDIFKSCKRGDFRSALICLKQLRGSGYSSTDIGASMMDFIKFYETDLSEKDKIRYMTEITKTTLIISKGVDSPLQLTGCIANLCRRPD